MNQMEERRDKLYHIMFICSQYLLSVETVMCIIRIPVAYCTYCPIDRTSYVGLPYLLITLVFIQTIYSKQNRRCSYYL